jgi:hypothetical protein
MSMHKNSAPYTASDIEKYRKGELSAREMHDLEQAALDDPFLADAIEGLMQHPILEEDLADLQDRLNRKVAEQSRRAAIIRIGRRITFAAAVILLLGVGFIFFYRHSGQPQPVHQPANNATAKALLPSAPAAVAANTPPATEFKAAAAHRHHLPATDTRPTTPPAENQTQPPYAGDSAIALDKQRLANATYFNFHPNPIVLSGKVLDLQNHPLAGAFLALKGNPGFGTITDEQGQFRISFHPRDSTRQLTVSMIGYDHASFAVNALYPDGQQNNIIRLKPHGSALDELVVSGYGKHRKETEVIAPSDDDDEKLDTLWINATPVIGRPAYRQYLNGTKKMLALDSTITGTETLSFIVSRDGSLSSFKIEQSLSPAHDAGIMRLVTDGPAWRLIRGKKVRASVTINF